MKIAMFTNTYLPHVGGVARSIKTLEDGCRLMGHEVRVVAPEYDGAEISPEVLRVPAIQHFHGSDFCVRVPLPNLVRDFMEDFQPDIIHSHHPFLLGDAALRESWKMRVPIVFTHHTLYERYTHYVPLDSAALKRVAIQIATEYCNLCDLVIAPSRSMGKLLIDRGVIIPIKVVPTGIDTRRFGKGDGAGYRERLGIPAGAQVIGHVGRLAEEKNLAYLAHAVALCLEREPAAVFLLVGSGDWREKMLEILTASSTASRIYDAGCLSGDELVDAYSAIDCFAFSSQTETQGIVLAEAMAAGKPVVALDGPGVRDIVRDGKNGILLDGGATEEEFARALLRLIGDPGLREACSDAARRSAARYDIRRCVGRMLQIYRRLIEHGDRVVLGDPTQWDRVVNGVEIEWELLAAKIAAASAAWLATSSPEVRLD
ncbi:MAG: glycosyltransferase [Akkermansiaceae bacterium]